MKHFSFFIFAICLCACNAKQKQLAFYDDALVEDSATLWSDSIDIETSDTVPSLEMAIPDKPNNEIWVPFVEQSGVKLIDVTVNRKFTIKMVLDSGCSTSLISIAEARYLYDKGCFTEEDILGITQSQIADGSIVENMVINLRELIIGGQIICPNVTAVVSSNTRAPLLLGNDVLNRVPAYVVDNENEVIKFKMQP